MKQLLIDWIVESRPRDWTYPRDMEGHLPHVKRALQMSAVFVLDEKTKDACDQLEAAVRTDVFIRNRVIQAARLPAADCWIEHEFRQRGANWRLGALLTSSEHYSELPNARPGYFATFILAAARQPRIDGRPWAFQKSTMVLVEGTGLVVENDPPALKSSYTFVGDEYPLQAEPGDLTTLCALALINSRQVGVNFKRTQYVGRSPTGRKTRYLSARWLTITVPKERAVQRCIEHQTGAHPRAHTVIGHWCERRHTGRQNCIHEFEAHQDDPDQYTCKLCGRRRWWRRPFQRGDAGRGFVIKRYNVTHRYLH